MPLKNGFVDINSFGFGGFNVHLLLKWNPKKKVNGTLTDDLPRLVVLSGRTKESVKLFFNDVTMYFKAVIILFLAVRNITLLHLYYIYL